VSDATAANRTAHPGGECELVDGDGAPLVVGELQAERADVPTVLIYGHYDVLAPGPLAQWTTPPFEPQIRDGRLYARGASDDKGNLLPLLHVACATSYTLRADARRFENWETNYSTKIALGVAGEYAMNWGIEGISERVKLLAARMRDGVAGIPGVSVMDLGRERCAIVSFTVAGRDPPEVSARLASAGINTSVSSVEDTLRDMTARGHDKWVRASAHYYNAEDEIDALIDRVEDLAK
jgi:hypothetical protein